MKTKIFHFAGGSLYPAVTALLLVASNGSRADGAPQISPAHGQGTPEFVFVAGQVNRPQRYAYTNGLTLSAAIRMAGGVTDQASSRNVTLTRKVRRPVTLDRKAIAEGKAKNIELQPGDKVFVPAK